MKRAIESNLSCLRTTEREREMVLRTALGGKKARKKLPLAVVLAIVLLLAAMTALAAVLLKGQVFVQQILVPMATESNSNKFSRQELNQIMELAEENGIVLPDLWQTKLSNVKAEYKEEVLRAFMKSEFGFYPMSWPMEVQYWFDELLISLGYYDDDSNLRLPEDGETTQGEIVNKAVEYLHIHFGAGDELLDNSLYIRQMVFYQPIDRLDHSQREWYIEYMPLDIWHAGYTLLMTPDGTVKEVSLSPGLDAAVPDDVYRIYQDMHGTIEEWDSNIRAAYILDIQKALSMHPEEEHRAKILLNEALALDELN